MAFRKATGRERCNVCTDLIPAGAWLWSGEYAPGVFWCEAKARDVLGRVRTGDETGYRVVEPIKMTADVVKEFPAVARAVERANPPRERWYPDADDDGDAVEPEIEDI